MVFSNEKLPHMFNKIIEEINSIAQDKNKIGISDLKKIIINFRLTLDDVDFFIKYLQDNGIIERKGRIVYILNKPITTEKKGPGRPSKLTEEEKRYIKENYIPNEKGVRQLANKINEKRTNQNLEPICFKTILNNAI